jgi:hypothetical protein
MVDSPSSVNFEFGCPGERLEFLWGSYIHPWPRMFRSWRKVVLGSSWTMLLPSSAVKSQHSCKAWRSCRRVWPTSTWKSGHDFDFLLFLLCSYFLWPVLKCGEAKRKFCGSFKKELIDSKKGNYGKHLNQVQALQTCRYFLATVVWSVAWFFYRRIKSDLPCQNILLFKKCLQASVPWPWPITPKWNCDELWLGALKGQGNKEFWKVRLLRETEYVYFHTTNKQKSQFL